MTKIKKILGDNLTWSHATIHVWCLYMNVISCVIRQAELKYVVLPILKFYFLSGCQKDLETVQLYFTGTENTGNVRPKENAFFDHILLIYNTVCSKIRGKSAIVRRFSICLPQRVKRFFDKKVKCSSCSSASEIQSKITISYYFTVFPPFLVHCVFVDLIWSEKFLLALILQA